MPKNKSITCDRCGASVPLEDSIPEKCPQCGEELRSRMEPHIREKLEKKLKPFQFKWDSPLGKTIRFGSAFLLAFVVYLLLQEGVYAIFQDLKNIYKNLTVLIIFFTAMMLFSVFVFFQSKKARIISIIVFGSFLLLIPIGLLSNSLSRKACEESVARWLAKDVMSNKPFYIYKRDATSKIIDAFDSIGAIYVIYDENNPLSLPGPKTFYQGYAMPNCEFDSEEFMPFVISAEYGYMLAPLMGQGTTRFYFCFFGLVFYICDGMVMWVS